MDWSPAADDTLFFELVSVSPVPMMDLARRAATVLDGAGDLAPDRGGYSERTRLLDAGGLRGMVAAASEKRQRKGLWVIFERRALELWGDLRFFADTALATAPRSQHAGFWLPAQRALADTELLESAINLGCDLFVALDAFYGRIDTGAMRRRRLELRSQAADRGEMWIPRWDDPTFVIWDRWIEDVWWITLFGPAYVERWGLDRMERLGVARRRLANGGIAIWSTALPPDPQDSDSIAGYPHKRSFYDVLGVDTFIHESLEIPERGVRVPLLREHARAPVVGRKP